MSSTMETTADKKRKLNLERDEKNRKLQIKLQIARDEQDAKQVARYVVIFAEGLLKSSKDSFGAKVKSLYLESLLNILHGPQHELGTTVEEICGCQCQCIDKYCDHSLEPDEHPGCIDECTPSKKTVWLSVFAPAVNHDDLTPYQEREEYMWRFSVLEKQFGKDVMPVFDEQTDIATLKSEYVRIIRDLMAGYKPLV